MFSKDQRFLGLWLMFSDDQRFWILAHVFRDLGFLDLGSSFQRTKGFLGFGSCFQGTKGSGSLIMIFWYLLEIAWGLHLEGLNLAYGLLVFA